MLMSDLYGSMVFDDRVMSKRLPKDTYRELKRCCALDLPLSRETANIVANEMKDWSVEKGVTHFTHWFNLSPESPPKSTILLSLRQRKAASSWSLAAKNL